MKITFVSSSSEKQIRCYWRARHTRRVFCQPRRIPGLEALQDRILDTPPEEQNLNTQSSATIVQRLWNYCNVLRDNGVSYGDYVDQRRWQAVLKQAFEGRLVVQDRPSLF